MIKARILYFLEVIVERTIILLFAFDKYVEYRLGKPVLINTHGYNLLVYILLVMFIGLMSYVLLTKRSVLITWTLLLRKDLDRYGYYQKITDEIEEGA